MWQLVQVVTGLADACAELAVPVTGGNVSLYNTSGEPGTIDSSIHPTPVVGVLGVIDDVPGSRRPAGGSPGQAIYLLGTTRGELDGSAWADVVHSHLGGLPPAVDLAAERALGGRPGQRRQRHPGRRGARPVRGRSGDRARRGVRAVRHRGAGVPRRAVRARRGHPVRGAVRRVHRARGGRRAAHRGGQVRRPVHRARRAGAADRGHRRRGRPRGAGGLPGPRADGRGPVPGAPGRARRAARATLPAHFA